MGIGRDSSAYWANALFPDIFYHVRHELDKLHLNRLHHNIVYTRDSVCKRILTLLQLQNDIPVSPVRAGISHLQYIVIQNW